MSSRWEKFKRSDIGLTFTVDVLVRRKEVKDFVQGPILANPTATQRMKYDWLELICSTLACSPCPEPPAPQVPTPWPSGQFWCHRSGGPRWPPRQPRPQPRLKRDPTLYPHARHRRQLLDGVVHGSPLECAPLKEPRQEQAWQMIEKRGLVGGGSPGGGNSCYGNLCHM